MMPRENESGQTRHHGFDDVELIPAPSKKREQPTTEHERLELAHLRELAPRYALDDRGGVDVLLVDHGVDRLVRELGLDAFAEQVLLEASLRGARRQDL
jgi:hypothetical protein